MQDLSHRSLEPPVAPVVPGVTAIDRTRFAQAVPAQLIVQNRQQLKQQVLDALELGAREIVLDMAACVYVDAAGCGVLVSIARKTRDAGARLVLVHVTEDVRTIFEITHLDTLFSEMIQ